jgi:hypothetical protein
VAQTLNRKQQTGQAAVDDESVEPRHTKIPHTFNPMEGYPRNAKCFCGSGIKFKKCCADSLRSEVPVTEATELRAYVKNIKVNNLNKVR